MGGITLQLSLLHTQALTFACAQLIDISSLPLYRIVRIRDIDGRQENDDLPPKQVLQGSIPHILDDGISEPSRLGTGYCTRYGEG